MKLADALAKKWNIDHRVVLRSGTQGDWDSLAVYTPQVLRDGDGYRMYYTGATAAGEWCIGTATSDNLFDWVKHPEPIMTSGEDWDKEIDFPWPLKVGARTYIFYEAKKLSRAELLDPSCKWLGGMTVKHMRSRTTGMAVSENGVSFTKSPRPAFSFGPHGAWDGDGVCAARVYPVKNGFRMFYAGSDGRLVRSGIAHSTDLLDWTRDERNPIVDVGAPGEWDSATVLFGSVLALEDGYLGAYEGEDTAWMRIGLAHSKDMIHWTKYAGNPIVSADRPYTTHGTFVCAPNLVSHLGDIYLFYTHNIPIEGTIARIEVVKLQ